LIPGYSSTQCCCSKRRSDGHLL